MSEMTPERLAGNLRAAIKASGLTQKQVAERIDMAPPALSRVLSGKRRVSSLELALICTATHSDVLGILEADPLHGPSVRQGLAEGWMNAKRAYERGDLGQIIASQEIPPDFTGCGVERDGSYCDQHVEHWGPHHADLWWETPAPPAPDS